MEGENFKCGVCDRTFKDAEALKDHNLAKHPLLENSQAEKSSSSFKWLIFLVIIGLIIVGIFFISKKGSADNDTFIQCLTEKGAKMYGAYWCPVCNQQKKVLGDSSEIPYVECSLPNRAGQTEICISKNIESYPTWEFADGTRMVGVLTLNQLSQITDCPLED